MKRIYLLIVVALTLGSCVGNDNECTPAPTRGNPQVEFTIAFTNRQSRASVSDPGYPEERIIRELDILVFGSDGAYLYHRQATQVDASSRYRAVLVESTDELTLQLIANARSIIGGWLSRTDQGTTWAAIQDQLRDTSPARLVNSAQFQPLPMWGSVRGRLSEDNSHWGTIQMLRSVASCDLFVEENPATALFVLTEMYLYFAPDVGYLAPRPDGTGYLLTPPGSMRTSLTTQLQATKVERLSILGSDGVQTDAMAIKGQMYFYDNDAVQPTLSAGRRTSRLVLGGYYGQTAPEAGQPDNRVKSYYALDFLYEDGTYRPLIRNWKYELRVNSVSGPGLPTPEEAARSQSSQLSLEIIPWNTEDMTLLPQAR